MSRSREFFHRRRLWRHPLAADHLLGPRARVVEDDRRIAARAVQMRLGDLQGERRGRRGIEGIAAALQHRHADLLAIQCVLATTPKVPAISGRVVNMSSSPDCVTHKLAPRSAPAKRSSWPAAGQRLASRGGWPGQPRLCASNRYGDVHAGSGRRSKRCRQGHAAGCSPSALADDPRFRFVRRVITRPAQAGGEAHEPVTDAEFATRDIRPVLAGPRAALRHPRRHRGGSASRPRRGRQHLTRRHYAGSPTLPGARDRDHRTAGKSWPHASRRAGEKASRTSPRDSHDVAIPDGVPARDRAERYDDTDRHARFLAALNRAAEAARR